MIWVQNVSATPVTISSSTTWNSSTTLPTGPAPAPDYREGIIISSNATFTVDGITLSFNSAKSISVSAGCKLILIGATLNSVFNTWTGIVATGIPVQEQYSIFPTNDLNNELTWQGVLNNNQTQVIIKNTFIYNAKIGIKSINGAIIQSRNNNFYNCENFIHLENYKSPSNPEINASYFMGNSFNWNDVISGFNSSDFIGINLIKVRGINIGGCSFLNNDPTQYCKLTRGIGIKSEESDFVISRDGDELCSDGRTGCDGNCFSSSGDGNPTTFEGLTYGIVTLGNSSNKTDRIVIRDCVFSNNLNSVDINYSIHSIIFESTFYADRNSLNNQYIDNSNNNQCDYSSFTNGTFISAINSSAVRIVENTLNYNSTDWTFIKVQETGMKAKSIIRKNDIKNSNSSIGGSNNIYGIVSLENNSNLEIECNNFDNLSYDIFCEYQSKLKNIERLGLSNANVWSYATSTNGRFNIFNDGLDITIVLHNGSSFRKGGTNFYGTNINFNNNDINCDPLDDCNELTDETGLKINKMIYNLIKVFPNPTFDFLNINLNRNNLLHSKIIIYDTNGKMIRSDNLNDKMQIDISKLPVGLYYIKIFNEKIIFTQKVLKKQ